MYSPLTDEQYGAIDLGTLNILALNKMKTIRESKAKNAPQEEQKLIQIFNHKQSLVNYFLGK